MRSHGLFFFPLYGQCCLLRCRPAFLRQWLFVGTAGSSRCGRRFAGTGERRPPVVYIVHAHETPFLLRCQRGDGGGPPPRLKTKFGDACLFLHKQIAKPVLNVTLKYGHRPAGRQREAVDYSGRWSIGEFGYNGNFSVEGLAMEVGFLIPGEETQLGLAHDKPAG